MTLSLALNNALSGLNVNQQSLAILSQNIANANTAGYSKQVAMQESIYLAGNGNGVTIQDVSRRVDEYLVGAVRGQTAAVGKAATITDYNDRIQLLLGNPGSSNSISSFVTTFFNAMQSLAQTPENTTQQQIAVNAGESLAGQISSLASGLQELQFTADKDIEVSINAINGALQQIAQLNSAISYSKSLGKSLPDAEDKRDALLNDISQYMDIKTFTRESGAISITTGGGVSLLDESAYQLNYTAAAQASNFTADHVSQAITVSRLGADGNPTGTPIVLVSSGTSETVSSAIVSGKIRGLLDIRDQDIPATMQQLDVMAAALRDQMNAIHNTGTGYPGTNSYTGTRLLNPQSTSLWSGSIRLGVLDATGNPINSEYGSYMTNGVAPLEIDLSQLDTGSGAGNPSVQGIINEINEYYGVPQNLVNLGNLSNIELTSNTASLPGSGTFNFDFDLTNLSGTSSNFYVTRVAITDDTNAVMTAPTSTIPTVTLASTGTYNTTANSDTVVVNTTSPNGLVNGQIVYLSTPTLPATIGGVSSSEFGGYFTISNVTSSSFEITIATPADSNPAVGTAATDVAGQTALPPYSTVEAGDANRTTSDGTFTASLAGYTTSAYYTVTADVAVDDGTGNIQITQVSYRVLNDSSNLVNKRYAAQSANGDATLVEPTNATQPIAVAMLVDANGKELPKIGSEYINTKDGYLVIKAANSNYTVAIDSLDSKQLGTNGGNGTNRGFAHYFELNNFFNSNAPITTGDTVANSALNLSVAERLKTNPSLISMGTMTLSNQPVDTSLPPNYTYTREKGDNSVIQKLAALGTNAVAFSTAGGLSATSTTFANYGSSIIGLVSQKGANAASTQQNAQTLLDGFTTRSSSISGVNLDTELANTIIYQNAYTASARIITVTNDLFESLLASFR